MIEEIPLDYTHPGMPRAEYISASKTDQLLQEATRSLADVGFAPAVSTGGIHRQDTGLQHQDVSHARGSEWDESGQDYSLPEGAHDGSYANYAAGQEVDDSRFENPNNSTTPIYATHSSVNRSLNAPSHEVAEIPQDSAVEEWRRTNLAEEPVAGTYGANSSTPIADQFASRSPEEVQVGGTGLMMVGGGANYNRSTESFERPTPAADYGGAGSEHSHNVATHPSVPRLRTPSPQDFSLQTPEERYSIAPTAPSAAATTSLASPTLAQDDASYFQSVGSTRAAQQAIRRPTSQSSNSLHNAHIIGGVGGAAGGYSLPGGQAPSGSYEPQPEGRKMTAAAFRKGFARVSSGQQVPTTTSTTYGGSHANGSVDHNGYGQEDGTAPLAIRKRLSPRFGRSASPIEDHQAPAPPYDNSNRLSSAYGGYAGAEEYAPPIQSYAEAPRTSSHPVPGQFYTPSYNDSRPNSAAGWRTPNS
jgi:hypothetical protein